MRDARCSQTPEADSRQPTQAPPRDLRPRAGPATERAGRQKSARGGGAALGRGGAGTRGPRTREPGVGWRGRNIALAGRSLGAGGGPGRAWRPSPGARAGPEPVGALGRGLGPVGGCGRGGAYEPVGGCVGASWLRGHGQGAVVSPWVPRGAPPPPPPPPSPSPPAAPWSAVAASAQTLPPARPVQAGSDHDGSLCLRLSEAQDTFGVGS